MRPSVWVWELSESGALIDIQPPRIRPAPARLALQRSPGEHMRVDRPTAAEAFAGAGAGSSIHFYLDK